MATTTDTATRDRPVARPVVQPVRVAVFDDGDGEHGRRVAALIAHAASEFGGAPPPRIVPFEVLKGGRPVPNAVLADAIHAAVEGDARVLNFSFGARREDAAVLRTAIEYAGAHGVLVVAAVGNGFRRGFDFPASFELGHVLAVVGLDSRGQPYALSNFDPGREAIAASASGTIERAGAVSAAENATTVMGTSFAAARVSGVAAAMLGCAAFAAASPDELRRVLLGQGRRLAGFGTSDPFLAQASC